jgi:hypothetical protein
MKLLIEHLEASLWGELVAVAAAIAITPDPT